KLQPLRHDRLVVAVRELTSERGKKKVGRDEDGRCQGNQGFGLGPADVKQDQKNERVLEKIVAEGGKELGPEQGREAPRHEQGRGHGLSIRRAVEWPNAERNKRAKRRQFGAKDNPAARRALAGTTGRRVNGGNANP